MSFNADKYNYFVTTGMSFKVFFFSFFIDEIYIVKNLSPILGGLPPPFPLRRTNNNDDNDDDNDK